MLKDSMTTLIRRTVMQNKRVRFAIIISLILIMLSLVLMGLVAFELMPLYPTRYVYYFILSIALTIQITCFFIQGE